jgi:dipeptide/tripeptide permease
MVNEICERFSYYGLRAILALYLKGKCFIANAPNFYVTFIDCLFQDQLKFSPNTATEIVHGFTMAAYGITVLGGYISDAVLGKYRTILYFSLVPQPSFAHTYIKIKFC